MPYCFPFSDPGHYSTLPPQAMMPSTPGESSAGASTPMTYPSPWDFDTTPLPAQEQPAGAQQFEYATQQDALYGGAPPPQNHAPTVIQLEERPAPLPRSRQRRAQGSRTPRLHVETTGESSAVRPSTAGGIAPSGPARVSPVHVHAERERERVPRTYCRPPTSGTTSFPPAGHIATAAGRTARVCPALVDAHGRQKYRISDAQHVLRDDDNAQ